MTGKIPEKKLILCGDDGDGNDVKYNEDTESECSLSLDKLNFEPRRKKLLVFDLNGLLVYRVYGSNKPNVPSDRTPDGKFGKHLVFKRPFAEEFMQFCLERFEIGIWSSALEKNVDDVLTCVMENQKNRLLFVWGQSQCTDSGFKSLEKRMKPLFFKELKKLWNHFGGKYSECDTLLIDDQPYKALLNPAHTGIFLESYNPDNASDNLLDPHGELGVYLDGLVDANDAQVYVKENPIGVPAISSDHPDWNFYSEVLRRFNGESEENTSRSLCFGIMPGKNRPSQRKKYHPFFDYSSDEFYDSSDYDSDDDFYYWSTARGNNDSKETGSDSGLSLEKLSIKPRKKLLVLGLNGLLVYRVFRYNKAGFPTTRNPDGRYAYQLVFRRPLAREFIEFCLERFEVAVWSCAQEKGKVKGVLDRAIGIVNRPKLSVVFDQDECSDSGLKSLEDKRKPLVFKRLEKMWNYFGGKYSESDTLLIDDQPYQALLNPPHTSIFMESYNPDNASDNALDPNGELGVYLDGLAAANDVQAYVKGNPFGLPAMSDDHPDWNFYSNALHGLEDEK